MSDTGSGPNCNAEDPLSCDCDEDDDGVNEIISEEGRAWLDFTGVIDTDNPLYPTPCGESTGCGTSEIVCWINNLEPAPIRIPPGGLCIGGTRGVKAGAKDDVRDRANLEPPNNIVHIPIFQGYCTPPNCLEGYNVVELGCVKVVEWEHQKVLPYKDTDLHGNCWKGKLIKTEVSCDKTACKTQCGHATGGGCPTGTSTICTVNLIE